MDQRTVLVGTLSMTSLVSADPYPHVIHEMDRCAALVGTLIVTMLTTLFGTKSLHIMSSAIDHLYPLYPLLSVSAPLRLCVEFFSLCDKKSMRICVITRA